MATGLVEAPQKQAKPMTIRDRLNSKAQLEEFARAMPAHCKPERMARVALTAISRTPKLANCDQASFFKCLLDLSQWGLEPDGRRAHLIPYENRKKQITECQLIIDYKGYVELVYRSGIVKSIHADVVRRGDLFEYNLGHVRQHVPHFLRIDSAKPEKAGDVFAVYCMVELLGGTVKTEIMSKDEVESIKERSSGWQAFKKGYTASTPWQTDWNEMAKKTAFRRASKWLPMSAEIVDAFDRDDDKLDDIPTATQVRSFDEIGNLLSGTGDSESDDSQVIEGTATDAQEATEPDLNAAFAQYQDELAKTKTPLEASACYDLWFGPESKVNFPPQTDQLAVGLRNEHVAKLSGKKK